VEANNTTQSPTRAARASQVVRFQGVGGSKRGTGLACPAARTNSCSVRASMSSRVPLDVVRHSAAILDWTLGQVNEPK